MRQKSKKPIDPPVSATTKRRILQIGAIGLGGLTTLAGCVEDGDESAAGTVNNSTPTESPTETPDEETPAETPTEEDTPEETPSEDDEDNEEGEAEADERWGDDWYIQPEAWASVLDESLECPDEDAQRYEQGFDEDALRWGDAAAWELRIDTQSAEYADTVRIRLRNVSDDTRSRRGHSLFNLQIKTDAGWEDVRVYETREQRGPPTGAVRNYAADEYHEWELTLTEDETPGVDVCPELQEGRYRFAYYGFESDKEDPPLAVGFNFYR